MSEPVTLLDITIATLVVAVMVLTALRWMLGETPEL
jgi:hypothetical protein